MEIFVRLYGDTGDGWDSTRAMAKLVGEEALTVEGVDEKLYRGKFLVLGGDEVYPCASKEAYKERLVAPFEDAHPPKPQRGAKTIHRISMQYRVITIGTTAWSVSCVFFIRAVVSVLENPAGEKLFCPEVA